MFWPLPAVAVYAQVTFKIHFFEPAIHPLIIVPCVTHLYCINMIELSTAERQKARSYRKPPALCSIEFPNVKVPRNNRDETSDTRDGDSSIAVGQQKKNLQEKIYTIAC